LVMAKVECLQRKQQHSNDYAHYNGVADEP
jgi:hypothetical protein